MRKKNAFQMLLIIVFSLIFLVSAYLIVKEALFIGKQTAEINNIEALIGQQQALLKKMKDAEAQSAQLEAQLSVLRKMIPEEPEQNHFLVWVQQISSDASLKMTGISFGEHTEQEDGYVIMPFHLTMQGNFQGLLNFLSQLMNGERLVRVDDIDLSDSNGILSMNITANLFYRKSP